MGSSAFTQEARKAVRSMTKIGLCIYMHPIDARLLNPRADFDMVWRVTVEWMADAEKRDWRQLRSERPNLSDAVLDVYRQARAQYRPKKRKR